jgi:hypothetical protein
MSPCRKQPWHKDDFLRRLKNQVRLTGKIVAMKAVAIALAVDELSHHQLGSGIGAPFTARTKWILFPLKLYFGSLQLCRLFLPQTT